MIVFEEALFLFNIFYKILNIIFKYSRRAGRDGGFDSDCL